MENQVSYIGKPCPKCRHIRTAGENTPDWLCPKCGVAYAKASAVGGAEPSSTDTPYRAPRSVVADQPGDVNAAKPPLKTILFSFSGRAPRIVVWFYQIVLQFAIGMVSALVENIVFLLMPLVVASIWSSLAASVKRCHDRDKSGWWLLFFCFVPIIGWFWGFVELMFLRGTEGSNRFGPDATELY